MCRRAAAGLAAGLAAEGRSKPFVMWLMQNQPQFFLALSMYCVTKPPKKIEGGWRGSRAAAGETCPHDDLTL